MSNWFRKTRQALGLSEGAPPCSTCGHPGRLPWGCGKFPELPELERRNGRVNHDTRAPEETHLPAFPRGGSDLPAFPARPRLERYNPLGLAREHLCTRRAPGCRRSSRRAIYINLSGTSETSLVEHYYDYGVRRDRGVALEIFCVAADDPCCFVYLFEDETDGSYRMVRDLKISVPAHPAVAKVIRNSLQWAFLQRFVGVPDAYPVRDVPRREDAMRLVQREMA